MGRLLFAIETSEIEDALKSEYDAIVLASVDGSQRLQNAFGPQVIPIYLWPGVPQSLRNPRCLEPDYEHVREIKRRIRKKLLEDGFSEFETASLSDDGFLEKRMVDNY